MDLAKRAGLPFDAVASRELHFEVIKDKGREPIYINVDGNFVDILDISESYIRDFQGKGTHMRRLYTLDHQMRDLILRVL